MRRRQHRPIVEPVSHHGHAATLGLQCAHCSKLVGWCALCTPIGNAHTGGQPGDGIGAVARKQIHAHSCLAQPGHGCADEEPAPPRCPHRRGGCRRRSNRCRLGGSGKVGRLGRGHDRAPAARAGAFRADYRAARRRNAADMPDCRGAGAYCGVRLLPISFETSASVRYSYSVTTRLTPATRLAASAAPRPSFCVTRPIR